MNELIGDGLQLMVLGMGTVFLFLGLLVVVVTLCSRIIQNLEASLATPAELTASPEDELLEVMAAAVQRYRSDHPR